MNDISLLHDDRDFVPMADHLGLKMLSPAITHSQKGGTDYFTMPLKNGRDLLINLRVKAILSLFFLLAGLCLLPRLGQAAPPVDKGNVVSEPVLDRAITQVLEQPEFAWRLPREQAVEKQGASTGILARLTLPLQQFFQETGTWVGNLLKNSVHWLADNLGSLFDWLKDFFHHKRERETRDFNFKEFSEPAALILIAAITFIILLLLIRSFRKRNRPVAAEVISEPVLSVPDLAAETTTADQLEEDQWLALAGEMLEKNEIRLAMRAFFLAGLALLGRQRLINIAPFKTNRDYLRELSRSGHALAGVIEPFTENINLFEKSWYGDHHISNDILARIRENANLMRACCG